MQARWTVGRMLTAGFAVALAALVLVGASAYTRIGELIQARQPLSKTQHAFGGIFRLNDQVDQVDRAERGYLVAPDPAKLRLYRGSVATLTATVEQVQRQSAADPVLQQGIDALRPALAAAAPATPVPDSGRAVKFDRMTDLVSAMRDHVGAQLDQRQRATDENARHTRRLIVVVSLLTALLVAAAGRWITRRITSAATEVTGAAKRVIDGDLTRPAEVTAPIELAQMARAVNASMTAMAGARDEALAATAAKSSFLAAMSHEIRTPMNAVIGGIGLMDDGSLSGQQRELLHIVRSSADALLVIINDVLDFSKIEAGELRLDEQPCDLRELVDDAVKLVALTADAKSLRLTTEIAADCPATVVTDESRMRQILVNLVGNAVKFTDEGGVSVHVRTVPPRPDFSLEPSSLEPFSVEPDESPQTGHGARVGLRIAVRDTGIGIDSDQIQRLFAAFTQVDASSTRRRAGTGLGLAISRRLAEAMGGTISVRSEPGEGSTFTVDVVAGIGADLATRPAAPTGDGQGQAPLHVLLAEDNPINQRVAELMLTRRGHRVDIVGTGADAVRAVRDVPYDLVLMDVRMPDIDGLQATELIRADPPPRGMPVIVALTANATVEDRAAGRRAGMDDFLAKPIQEAQLDIVLAAAAGHADTDRHLSTTAAPAMATPGSGAAAPPRATVGSATIGTARPATGGGPFGGAGSGGPPGDLPAHPASGGGDSARPVSGGRSAPGGKVPPSSAAERSAEPGPGGSGNVGAAQEAAAQEEADIRAAVAAIAGARFADQERLAEILRAFADRLPAVLADLDRAVAESDNRGAEHVLHGLKGSAATLGSQRLAAACARLEARVREGGAATLEPSLGDLRDLAEAAGRAVTEVSRELSEAGLR